MAKMVITPSLFYQYATCPHWLWYDRYGDPARKGELPELAQKLLDQGVVHEFEYVKGLEYEHVKLTAPKKAFEKTLELMRKGTALIYQGALEATIDGHLWRGRPDLLERRAGKSVFGNYQYVPIEIKSAHAVHDTHELQLAFYALLLREIQGVRPKDAAIINVDRKQLPLRIDEILVKKTRTLVARMVAVMAGEMPPLKLGSKCKHSPWFHECIRRAEEANDIALIYNVHPRTLEALRAQGIHTVTQAARMNVARVEHALHASTTKLERIRLQAQSLLDKQLRWLKKPEIPESPLKLYFDIEGDPLLDVEYLFGFWVVGDPERQLATIGQVHDDGSGDGYFLYFLAERPEQEVTMWKQFLDWVELLPRQGYQVYHFADYERSRTLLLAKEYGGSKAFERFADHYVDLSKVVQASVIFPLYFYSIKDIARSPFLNYKWRHAKAGGAQSIFWYENWISTGNRRVLQDIVDYNEDDVIATAHLHQWLVRYGP